MNKLVPATGLALAISTPVTAQDNPTAKAVFVNLAGAKIGAAIYVARRAGCLRSDGAASRRVGADGVRRNHTSSVVAANVCFEKVANLFSMTEMRAQIRHPISPEFA
jgi:hypothetical protein